MADEAKKDAVGDLGLSGYIKVYPSSRSIGTVVKKSARGAHGLSATKKDLVPASKPDRR